MKTARFFPTLTAWPFIILNAGAKPAIIALEDSCVNTNSGTEVSTVASPSFLFHLPVRSFALTIFALYF